MKKNGNSTKIAQPAKNLCGTLRLNGDKSISHRAAMFAALADGETHITGFSSSADCASTLECLQKLGVPIRRNKTEIFVQGVGKKGFVPPSESLNCGNSGTTMRLMAGILAGQNFPSVLIGDESLSARPMKRIIEPLSLMNAEIKAEENRAPLRIFGKNPLKAITYTTPKASAQVKSCLLLAGLNATGRTEIIEKTATRNHTELMLRYLGAEIEEKITENGKLISINGNSELSAKPLDVPADISSAAFFLVAAACLPNSELRLPNVGLNPTRTAILDVLRSCGAMIEILEEREIAGEKRGDLLVRGSVNLAPKTNVGNVLRGSIIANLIDELPILSVFGTQIEGGLEIREAEELRVKESDRIRAVVENLRKMSAKVEEFPDGLRVEKSNLKGANLNSFGDHRIAMAFSIAALFAEGVTEIIGADCAKVSFPEFFALLASVTE